ncbi:uncharacterized protein TNCV_3455801 [Trichonephila clavipes]|nr:uncharacterized protein TNCV_3455801 [Trichonephila clavipes]
MKRKENFQWLPKELHQLKYEAISVPQGSVRLVKKTQERKSSTCCLLITKGVTSSSPVPLKTRRERESLYAEIVEVEIEVVSPSIVPSGNFAELNRTVTCMVLKANDRRTSCPCHDEFRGPRSDYVRQYTWNNFIPHLPESTGTSTFPLIADGLQTSGVLPSLQEQEHFPSSRTDYRLLVFHLVLMAAGRGLSRHLADHLESLQFYHGFGSGLRVADIHTGILMTTPSSALGTNELK